MRLRKYFFEKKYQQLLINNPYVFVFHCKNKLKVRNIKNRLLDHKIKMLFKQSSCIFYGNNASIMKEVKAPKELVLLHAQYDFTKVNHVDVERTTEVNKNALYQNILYFLQSKYYSLSGLSALTKNK